MNSRTRALARRTTAASAVLLLGLGLAACGGDDSDSDADSGRSDDERSSQSADPTDDPDTDTDTDTGSSDGPSDDDLAAALITSSEVPAGFVQQPADDSDDDENNTFVGTCFESLGKFSDALGVDDVAEAETEFLQESQTAQAGIGGELHFYGTDADVAGTFTDFTDRLRECTEISTTVDDGTQLDLTIAYDDGAGIPGADDELGFTMSGTIGGGGQSFPVAYRFEVALLGDVVSLITTYTLGEADPAVLDSAPQLATLQGERVAQLG